jgi:hypothetical protein
MSDGFVLKANEVGQRLGEYIRLLTVAQITSTMQRLLTTTVDPLGHERRSVSAVNDKPEETTGIVSGGGKKQKIGELVRQLHRF